MKRRVNIRLKSSVRLLVFILMEHVENQLACLVEHIWGRIKQFFFNIERIKLQSFHFGRTDENQVEKYNPFTGKFI